MVNQLTVFISVAASVFFISIVLMVFARRFQGTSQPVGPSHSNTSVVSLQQAAGRRRAVQFRPSNRPAKPYNPFSKDELSLLHRTTLTQADLDNMLSKGSIIPPAKHPNNEEASDAKSVASVDLGVLRYASQECSICLAPYEANDSVRVLTCEHVFHYECVDVWLTDRSARCPICKADNREALGLVFRKPEDTDGTQDEEPPARNRHHRIDILPPPPIALM
ncbi:hypothetical protein LPJ59_005464 [Coemansia sp. RSA 2399]|nr:hypothetical protein LPJ59_005464 [Coemansia sp. RSA 2399]KAJ1892313.1 hypothetical protein LPJ81_005579 [Coemansia sp. IMI 209127]